jgi:septum formation protein
MNDRANEHTHKSVSQLILASSSPRRKELVASLDLSLPVSVFSIEVDESIAPSWGAAEAVEQLSLAKAEAVVKAIANGATPAHISPHSALILAADTVVVVDGQILGKPASREEAFSTLNMLQGRSHDVYSGVVLMHSGATAADDRDAESSIAFGQFGQYQLLSDVTGEVAVAVGHTYSRVTFRPMLDQEIEAYVLTGEPMDKAGSYGIQGIGAVFVEKLEGDFYSVMGLPLNLLYPMLMNFGISPFRS